MNSELMLPTTADTDVDIFPTSFAQQRLWFLEQLEGKGQVYNSRLPVWLTGELHLDQLQQAVDSLVARHESLRTRFDVRGGEPVQIVSGQLPVPVQFVDMTGRSAGAIRARLAELAAEPFDLVTGPLLRVFVLEVSRTEHALLLVTHHAISDAWSSSIMFRDLAAFYDALVSGESDRLPDQLPELPIQYADYSVWQREWMQGEALQNQLEYWQEKLAGAPPLLELPTNRCRPPRQSFRGGRVTAKVPEQLTTGLKKLAGEQGCTLYMLMLAVFNVLLSRYSGQQDIVVGTPVAGRGRTELEGLVGLFVNNLVMRSDLSGNPSFKELLKQVRRTALDGWAHQELPFEKLVEALRPPRDLSHAPVFQVMFVLHNAPWEAQSIEGLKVAPADMDSTGASKFDLTLSAIEYGGSLWLTFEYSRDLFDESTIEQMAESFSCLLESVVTGSEQKVSSLKLQSDEQQHKLLQDWNSTSREFPRDETVADLVGNCARQYPDAIAAEYQSRCWSYSRLVNSSSALSVSLGELGLRQTELVAIYMGPSLERTAAMLAIWQAGAAWLPLDPSYPNQRLEFMLGDSGAGMLITQSALFDELPAFNGRIVSVNNNAEVERSTGSPGGHITESSRPLAYLIYTSGSTGQPKGVQITHRSVVNFLCSMTKVPGLSSTDRLLAVTSLGFDISVLELMLPLINGATSVIAPADNVSDGRALADLINNAQITVMQGTPATWQMLLQAGWSGNAEGLKILCGGEALDPGLAETLLNCGSSLWNLYGPTETTIWSACQQITDTDTRITVGLPIDNTQTYILDADLEPVPIAVTGELYIGGEGVSAGYHRQPELTARQFISNPFDANTLLYRTGDVARYHTDGSIEILGRTDFQFKLRGFRIEAGEIETAVNADQSIRQCVVQRWDDLSGNQRVVAYVVPAAEAIVDTVCLLRDLGSRLPVYMVPSAVVVIDELPLTPNGKLDRQALPAPDGTSVGVDNTQPRTLLEESLCGLFCEILEIDSIGIHADFFELGGHSLLATRLVSRIADALEVEVPLRSLFEKPTVAALNEAVRDGVRITAAKLQVSPIIARNPKTMTAMPVSFAQQRLWFLDQLEPGNPVYNLAWPLRLRGDFDVEALRHAMAVIVDRHEVLRMVFATSKGIPVQVPADRHDVPIMIEDLCGAVNGDLDSRLIELTLEPFDLTSGPLLRVHLLRLAPDDHVLLLLMHHVVSDGWSMSVLFRELSVAYNAFVQNELPELSALVMQYADYAVWQRRWLAGDELQHQMAYWRQQLVDAPPMLHLPTDRPRGVLPGRRGARVTRQVPEQLTTELRSLSRSQQCTLFMVLLAAFDVLLARHSGELDIVVGTPVAGRNRTELEGLIGFFINTLVLRNDLSGNPQFDELLERVKHTALEAYAHQDLPFEKLVDELQPVRDTRHTPVFQVLFNLHNEPKQTLEFKDLQIVPFGIDRGVCKFDLSINLVESDHGLRITFEYNTDLFDSETIESMLCQYVRLLESVVAAPQTRIASLSLLDEVSAGEQAAEAKRVRPRNRHEVLATEGTLASCFEVQVAQQGDRPAVRTQQHDWDYRSLDTHANRVAHALLAECGPRVGLMCRQDAPMVAGLLGILKAGHAYVPLDPGYPSARLQWLVEDAGLTTVVTDVASAGVAGRLGLPLVTVDALEERVPADRPQIKSSPDDLAYILYTSGSTGQPKGVMQTHRNVLHHVQAYSNSLQLGSSDRLSLLPSYGFDAAVQDIFGALLNGALLCPIDLRLGESPGAVVEQLAGLKVTVWHSTPTVYRHLLGGQLNCRQDLSGVRAVVLGGEEARKSDFELFRVRFVQGALFVNGLGPTESTTALQFFADHDSRLPGGVVPVGRAVSGTEVVLLDAAGEPAGLVGEIAICSDWVTPGYWGRDDLALENGWYRTGDIGRLLPDGNIAFVDRCDEQVKVRGHRVEPGEIESVLVRHAGVDECVVVVREGLPGEARLVAYVTGGAEIKELRALLKDWLPDYMLPQAIVSLEVIERLPNGKVDRSALPDPEWRGDGAFVPARNELEETLVLIWKDLLGVEQVGVHDDFFGLGGHSLLATRMIARLRDALGIDLPLLCLFEYPTVAGLAYSINEQQPRDPLPAITKLPRESVPA